MAQQNPELAKVAADGLTLFRCLEEAQEGQGLVAAYGETCKAVVMLRGTKIGFGLGGRMGRGFVLAKLPPAPGAASMQGIYRWSAPLFVKVRVAQGGLVFGYARSKSFLLSMDNCLLKELRSTGHSILGMDTSFTMFSPSAESKSDVIALSGGETALAGASLVTGMMLDFSFAGGSMRVDVDRLHRLYGPDATTEAVLSGQVPAPPELAPLYARINAKIEGARSPAPHLTRASLQRYTAGYDPDRRIITSRSARVIHRGDSEERLDVAGGAGVTAARVRAEE